MKKFHALAILAMAPEILLCGDPIITPVPKLEPKRTQVSKPHQGSREMARRRRQMQRTK